MLPNIEVDHCFPPGTAFGRLNHLEMSEHREYTPDDTGAMGLWEVMASGGLPALIKLRVQLLGGWRGKKGVSALMAPGLEAVAGTLTHLNLAQRTFCFPTRPREVEGGYELGLAVGQLRRLTHGPDALPVGRWSRLPRLCPARAWPPAGGTSLSPTCGGSR
jgi:hypothetical protein